MKEINLKSSTGLLHRKTNATEKFPAFLLLIAYLLSLAFEGPLRTALSIANIENALYVRDLLAFITIIIYAKPTAWRTENGSNLTAIGLYAIICHAILGVWIGHPLLPVLFAFKLFIAFLFGIAAASKILSNEYRFTKILAFIFIGSISGVYINSLFGILPWEGSEYETAFGTVRNARLWWSGGERRLPGFARASYSAAAIIGLTGAFLSAYLNRPYLKLLIFFTGMPAIYLTTSKGVIISYALVTGWTLIPNGTFKTKTAIYSTWLFSVLGATLPGVAAIFNANPTNIRTTPQSLGSFAERATITWPDALNAINNWYNWILGQGMGGVASPLRFGSEYWQFNPIDNLFLYLFLNFGILGALYYLFFTKKIQDLAKPSTPYHNGLFAMGLIILSYGITAHLMEDAFVSIIFGTLIAYQIERKITAKILK